MAETPDKIVPPLWSPDNLARALALEALPSIPSFSSISIDTRTLAPGDLFVALKGDASDGHTFLTQAFKTGACGALVSKRPPPDLAQVCLVVNDTEEALRRMAKFARRRATTTRVVGLTGSVGKTSVKEGLAHALKENGVFATPKSYNNHLGIPLSLAHMPPQVPFAIFEMGMNHAGEIRELARLVQPEIGLITAIGTAHIGNFSAPKDIALAKGELLEMLIPPRIAVLPRGSDYFEVLKEIAGRHACDSLITFGDHKSADIRLLNVKLLPDHTHLTCDCQGTIFSGRLPHAGRHWAENAMAILGVTSALGLDPALILKRLETWPCPKGRGSPQTLSWNGRALTLIDDSYNANPLSMTAALKVLGAHTGRRIAVLGDMGELGKYTEKAHQDLSEPLGKMNINVLLAVGPNMALLAERVASQMEVTTADDWTAALNKLDDLCQDGDVILLKGSRRMMLDRVADAVIAAHH